MDSSYRRNDIASLTAESWTVQVKVDKNASYLNGEAISKEELEATLYQLQIIYSPNFLILYQPDCAISYGRYIEYLDLFHSTADRLQDEMPTEADTIREKYSTRIIEWTEEEKQVMKLKHVMPKQMKE